MFFYADKNERDLVVLYHDIGVMWPGNRYEKKLVTLVSYGETNGYTAMAKTVGIPTAIAATMVLQGNNNECITNYCNENKCTSIAYSDRLYGSHQYL